MNTESHHVCTDCRYRDLTDTLHRLIKLLICVNPLSINHNNIHYSIITIHYLIFDLGTAHCVTVNVKLLTHHSVPLMQNAKWRLYKYYIYYIINIHSLILLSGLWESCVLVLLHVCKCILSSFFYRLHGGEENMWLWGVFWKLPDILLDSSSCFYVLGIFCHLDCLYCNCMQVYLYTRHLLHICLSWKRDPSLVALPEISSIFSLIKVSLGKLLLVRCESKDRVC